MFDWRSFVGNLISRGTDPRYLLLVSCGREEGIERRVCRICWMDENASFFFFYPLPFSFFFYVTSILSAIHVLSFFLSRIKWSFVRTAAPCGSCLIDRKPVTASTLARIKRHLRDQSSSIFRRVGIVSRKATPPRIHKILFLLSSLILFVHLSVTNR